jgi:hypothetical protein
VVDEDIVITLPNAQTIKPGSTEGSIAYDDDGKGTSFTEVTVTGLGHTGDGKYYFVDDATDPNTIAIIDNAGVQSYGFIIPENKINDNEITGAIDGDLTLRGAYKHSIRVKDQLDKNTIIANARKENANVVDLVGTNGINSVTYKVTHAKKFNTSDTNTKYTSNNTT